jgi:ketosteroid isomerase-like protein
MVGIAKVDPNAKGAVDKLTKGLAALAMWGDDLGARSDAVVVGPGNGDITRGKADIKKLFKKRIKANVRMTAAGDTTAATTSDGQLAWVTLPVVRFEDDVDPLPLRVFAVFEKNGADWKMIALQESLAVDQPGTGAAFKKVVAPALPKEEPPPPPPKKDEPPAKKKKKKKKKQPASDAG